MTTTISLPDSPTELRDRLAELLAKHQRLISHGDVVSRQDCRAEIEAIQAKLRGVKAPAKTDEGFFGREANYGREMKPALSPQARQTVSPAKPAAKRPALSPRLAELRDAVQEGMAKGLVRGPLDPVKIAKDGRDVQEQHRGVRSQWMEVDPAKARHWLENNFRNRPIDDDTVAAYARDMTNGVWIATHQGIAFNARDELIDGQHRLRAIIRCGRTVRMMVTFGLPSEIAGQEMTTMDAVDRGRTRSVADQLKIQHGMKDGSAIAQICAGLGFLCCGERTRRLSVGQTLEIFRGFEPAVAHVIAHRSREPGLKSAGVLSAFAFALAPEADPGKGAIARMFAGLVTGEGLGEGSAIGHLRAFLVSDDAKLLTHGSARGVAELVLEAIRLELRGRPIAKLEMSDAGKTHFRALQAARANKVAAIFKLPGKGEA